MDENKQIKEMVKCCPYYHNGECCADATDISKCDLMCEMFGVFANLEVAGYRKQEWISVEERLPEQYTAVIVCDENRFIGEAEYDGDGFRWVSDENLAFATHWMPLPQPPKGE